MRRTALFLAVASALFLGRLHHADHLSAGEVPPYELAIDCDAATLGVQSVCATSAAAGPVSVDIVLLNNSTEILETTGWAFEVTTNELLLEPEPASAAILDSNPNVNETFLGPGTWLCDRPAPQPDGDPSVVRARSAAGCFSEDFRPMTAIPAGQSAIVATIDYSKPGRAGTASLSFRFGATTDTDFNFSTNCEEYVGPCRAATLELGAVLPLPEITECAVALPSPARASIPGKISDIIFDPACKFLYAVNTTFNRIDVVSLATGEILPPITVGAQPLAADISEDGSQLFVANSGGNNVSLVDLTTRQEIRRIYLAPESGDNETPIGISVDRDNFALLPTTLRQHGGYCCHLAELDLLRGKSSISVSLTENQDIRRSGDRMRHFITAGPGSSTPEVIVYDTQGHTLSTEVVPNGGMQDFASDYSGATLAALTAYGNALTLMAEDFSLIGNVPGAGYGIQLSPDGLLAYRSNANAIEVIDVGTLASTGIVPFGDSVTWQYDSAQGDLALSDDGGMIAAITDNGVSILNLQAQQQPSPLLIDCPGACFLAATLPVVVDPSCLVAPSLPAVVNLGYHRISGVLVDDNCRFAYATNYVLNRVEVIDLQSGLLLQPIPVGTQPTSLDTSPDGSSLYVTNYGENSISVVDLVSRKELHRIPVPPNSSGDSPLEIALAANGKALIVTDFNGVGFGSRLLELDLATDAISTRSSVSNSTRLWRTRGHQFILVLLNNSSVMLYRAQDGTAVTRDLSADFVYAATSTNGLRTLVSSQTFTEPGTILVGDAPRFEQLGAVDGPGLGVAFLGDQPFAYRVTPSESVEILDTTRFLSIGSALLDDTISYDPYGYVGRIETSLDGALVAVLTDNGVSFLTPTDADLDGVGDARDNCPTAVNLDQVNSDRDLTSLASYGRPFDDKTWPQSDLLGDACDDDDDNDGLPDAAEATACPSGTAATDPLKRDTDGDQVLDGAECTLGSDPTNAASLPAAPTTDTDQDGLGDTFELSLGTAPGDGDSDDDGLSDGLEFKFYGSSPISGDSDLDGCRDAKEAASVNGDSVVNVADLGLVASSFGPSSGPRYIPFFDINRDGTIGVADMGIVASQARPPGCS